MNTALGVAAALLAGAFALEPEVDVAPNDNSVVAGVVSATPGGQIPGTPAPKPGVGPAGSAPPNCYDAPDTIHCTPVDVCVPDSISPTGFAVHLYVYGGKYESLTGMGTSMMGLCQPPPAATPAAARVTPALVLAEFRRIPLPAGKLSIQPPGGKTLVNLETIFSTQAGDLNRSVTLLGQTVELRITASTYTWHHGDGTRQTSDWPGRKWQGQPMSQYIVHLYEKKGTVTARVDVTYSATYRVGGAGPWLPVVGTVTVAGPGQQLEVLEARPVLVG